MPSRLVIALVAIVWFALAVGASPAQAQSDDPLDALSDDEAAAVLDLLRQAEARRDAGDCVTALVRYDEITAIVWLPRIRLRAAVCYAALDQPGAAESALREVIDRGSGAEADEARAELDELGRMHPAVLSLAVSGQAAQVFIDGELRGALDDERAEFELSPGEHVLRVTSPGHDAVEMPLDLGIAERASHSLAFATIAPVEPEPAPQPIAPPERRSLVAPLTLAGASAASFVTAGVLWARSDALFDDWEEELLGEDPSLNELNRLRERSESAARNGNIMAAVGAGLAVGAVITVFVPRRAGEHQDVSWQPLFDDGRVGASMGWRW